MSRAPSNRSGLTVLLALCCWLATAAHAADAQLEIFNLAHRPAEEIVPLVQPLLGEGEVVQAHGFALIVRAAPATVAQVRKIVAHLDRTPKRLLISVRQSHSSLGDAQGADAKIHVGPESGGAAVRVYSANDRDRGTVEQQVQALEGKPAYIAFGQSVPIEDRTVYWGVDGSAVQNNTRYRDVSSGFYVLPQVNGDRVRLQISPHRETLSRSDDGAINVQQADTVVEGRMNEWIEIGATFEQRGNGEGGITYRTRSRSDQNGRIAVKVEELH